MGKALIANVGLVVAWIVGSFIYVANYDYVVAEKRCEGGFFIQVGQYSAYNLFVVGMLGAPSESEGNLRITFSNGAKDYIPSVTFLGEGNQKIAIFDDTRWNRYVFGNNQIFEGTDPIQCF
jgi:hypothetical protein